MLVAEPVVEPAVTVVEPVNHGSGDVMLGVLIGVSSILVLVAILVVSIILCRSRRSENTSASTLADEETGSLMTDMASSSASAVSPRASPEKRAVCVADKKVNNAIIGSSGGYIHGGSSFGDASNFGRSSPRNLFADSLDSSKVTNSSPPSYNEAITSRSELIIQNE